MTKAKDTKARKGATEPSDDQQAAGDKAQAGAQTPAPDTPPTTESQAKAGADKDAAPVEKAKGAGDADPDKVAAQVKKAAETKPRQLTAEENAELSRQIKGLDEAAAEQPVDLLDRKGPDHLLVTVVGPVKGFRRIGRRFAQEPTVIGADEITLRQYKALEDTPELLVTLSEKPAALSAD